MLVFMILFGINFTFCIALPLPLLLIALDLKFEGFMFFFFFIVQNMGARKYGHASDIFLYLRMPNWSWAAICPGLKYAHSLGNNK